mgnify:CR=1 FL=1
MANGPTLHLLKLCVGAARVEDLRAWQDGQIATERAAGRKAVPLCTTRMWPKRAKDLLSGGSLYWVFKGLVLARQRILSFETVDFGDGVERCGIRLDAEIVRTEPQPRRPFQGWRYLPAAEAPRDLGLDASGEALPPGLQEALAAFGVRERRSQCG